MKVSLGEVRALYPHLSFKRINVRHHYRVIGRDKQGKIRFNEAWGFKKEKEEKEKKWLVTTITYKCGRDSDQGAWGFDVTKVSRREGEYARQAREQEDYCLEYFGRAFTYCFKNGEKAGIVSRSWERDLPETKYPAYYGAADVLRSMHKWFKSTEAEDCVCEEEILELRRCR